MIELDIPGAGTMRLDVLVLDFSGTLAFDGTLTPGVKERLIELAGPLEIHVLTSDTFGTASAQLDGIPCACTILGGDDHAGQKERYIRQLGPSRVAAIGNGMNDVQMLKAARLGIAVLEGEGVAAPAVAAADILARNIGDALGILLHPLRLKATLRK